MDQQNKPISDDKVENLFKITTDRMFMAIESFYLWKKFNTMMNINEVGKEEAEKNVETFRRHWNFFHPILSNSYKAFVTDLSIFFDAKKYEDTFSLGKLTDKIKEKVTENEYNQLLKNIEDIKREHGVKINFLLELRNAEVIHQEIERKSRQIIYKEIEDLFLGVQEILDLIRKYYDGAHTSWDHVGEDVTRGFEWLIKTLELGEKARQEEFEKKYSL